MLLKCAFFKQNSAISLEECVWVFTVLTTATRKLRINRSTINHFFKKILKKLDVVLAVVFACQALPLNRLAWGSWGKILTEYRRLYVAWSTYYSQSTALLAFLEDNHAFSDVFCECIVIKYVLLFKAKISEQNSQGSLQNKNQWKKLFKQSV